MRQLLDLLYKASGALAAVSLVAICVIVMAQVLGRVIDAVANALTGEQIGLIVPSAAEFSGFFLAGASFLALAYTFRHGGHIRVRLLVQRFSHGAQHVVEIWCLLVALGLAAFFAWNVVLLVIDSWEFHELSVGIIPVPLWIPQSFMALGLIVLTIALLDDLVHVVKGADPSYEGAGEDLLEEVKQEIAAETSTNSTAK